MASTQTPNASIRRLESLSTAAQYASVSTRTVRRWIARGDVRGWRAGKRIVRVDLNDVDAMLKRIPTAGGDAA